MIFSRCIYTDPSNQQNHRGKSHGDEISGGYGEGEEGGGGVGGGGGEEASVGGR